MGADNAVGVSTGRTTATTPDQRPGERHYIPTLDGWRAVAIAIVMAQHGADQVTRVLGGRAQSVTEVFRENGRFGVYIFFAISGYLICSRLLAEEDRTGRIDLAGFYIRRAFRILPPLVVFLAVISVLAQVGVIDVPLAKWLGSLFFVNNYVPGGSWYVGHFWSLAIEEHFYVMWPVLLVVLGRVRALRAGLGVIVVIAAWRLVDLSLELTANAPIRYDDRTDVHLDALMWGCVFAIVCLEPAWRLRLGRLVDGWRWWALATLLVATQLTNADQPGVHALQLALRPLLVGLLVVGTVLHPGSSTGRLLERRTMRWMGRISYSLYIWQQLFLVWDDFAAPQLSAVQRLPVSLACAFACAIISFRFVERPMTALGRSLAHRRSGRTPRHAA
jgi:peptidoglycan/LPS O-acetylase OafA/YrhL